MAKRSLAVLGSTGSVGTSTLDVVRTHGDRFEISGLVAGDNVAKLAAQIAEFKPRMAAVRTEKSLNELKSILASMTGIRSDLELVFGNAGAEKVASTPEAKIVVAAIVGAAGLKPTLAAIKAGKTIALANKESMVVAGALVSQAAREFRATILPVDSEHSAIFQALAGSPNQHVRKLWLTASGGPFFLKPEVNLKEVKAEQALKHPNWNMGAKITIDSATLMNKGLEIIEARWLFGFPEEQIHVIVHPQSIIHSMVEYVDGSVLAQLGVPDMKGPIAYALSYPERLDRVMNFLNFSQLKELNFYEPDHQRFPAIEIAREALSLGETFPAVLNGANEVTVQAFLSGKIGFLDICRINHDVMSSFTQHAYGSLDDYIEADAWGRQKALEAI